MLITKLFLLDFDASAVLLTLIEAIYGSWLIRKVDGVVGTGIVFLKLRYRW